jgi:integrase
VTPRREYGKGALYQRSSDWRWIGVVGETFNGSGDRKRITISGKGCPGGCKPRCPHVADIKRKLERRQAEHERGEIASTRVTVKQWADTYLEHRVRDLRPKAYNAAASPIRNWVVPTIGRKRLADLQPPDVRAVHKACRDAGRDPSDVHRVLKTMLKAAVADGHPVGHRVLAVKAPAPARSDRAAMTVAEGKVLLAEAGKMPNSSRWLFNVLYGARLGECTGLRWDAVDLDSAEAVIEWQLQPLPYNVPRDRSSGFRVPDDHESIHLIDSYHLTRPKSRAGYRVAPLLPPVVAAMRKWRAIAPESPHKLVWPEPSGRPRNDKHDRAEWHALQERAGVAHPSGRPYHMHECRNFAATMLLDAEVPEHVVTDLLGHTAVATSLRYRTVRREPLRAGMERVGERLQLGG